MTQKLLSEAALLQLDEKRRRFGRFEAPFLVCGWAITTANCIEPNVGSGPLCRDPGCSSFP